MPGTTTVTGGYNLNGGTLETEFGGVGNPIDLVDVTGNLDIALVGTLLELLPLGGMAAGTYTLMQTTGGTLTGMFENVTDLGIYDDLFGVQYTATTVTLTLDFDLLVGDFDLNGVVDGADFLKWQQDPTIGSLADWETNYGMVASLSASSAAVPEPNSLALLSLGGLLALRTFRRAKPFTASP
jgi:hypothetical protein